MLLFICKYEMFHAVLFYAICALDIRHANS